MICNEIRYNNQFGRCKGNMVLMGNKNDIPKTYVCDECGRVSYI